MSVTGFHGDARNTTAWQQGRVIQNAFLCRSEKAAREKLLSSLIGSSNVDNGGIVVYYKNDIVNNSVFTVEQGEMVFSRAYDSYGKVGLASSITKNPGVQTNALDNGYTTIFSSLNGAGEYGSRFMDQSKYDKLTADEKKALIRSNFVFQGLAQAQVDISAGGINEVSQRTEVAIQIGGIESVINTGTKSIMRGDYVIWDVQDPTMNHNEYPGSDKYPIRGVNTKKRLFVTEPLRPEHFINYNSVKKIIENGYSADKIIPALDNNAKDQRDDFCTIHRFIRGLVKFVVHIEGLVAAHNVVVAGGANVDALATAAYRGVVETLKINRDNNDARVNFHNNRLKELFSRNTIKFGDEPINMYANAFYNSALVDMFTSFASHNMDIHSRIIQRAISSAPPNCQYDALLGHGYCI